MIWRSLVAALLIIGLHSCTSEPMDFDAVEARAQQGEANAQNNLGVMYATEQGVPKNDIEAVKWYRLAAQQGYDMAQNNLGNTYATGRGVPEDDVEAVKWYRLAAQQGFAGAQSNLGFMYGEGEGVPQNDIKAYAWWSMAAAQGEEIISYRKDSVTEAMTPQQIAEAQAYATRCFENDYKGCD